MPMDVFENLQKKIDDHNNYAELAEMNRKARQREKIYMLLGVIAWLAVIVLIISVAVTSFGVTLQ